MLEIPAEDRVLRIAIGEQVKSRTSLLEFRPEERRCQKEYGDDVKLFALARCPSRTEKQPSKESHGEAEQEVSGRVGQLCRRNRSRPMDIANPPSTMTAVEIEIPKIT